MTSSLARRTASASTVLVALLALTTGCSDKQEPGTGDPCAGTAAGGDDVKTIEVTVEGGTVTPEGDRVDVGVDQPVDIVITSDEAGELHVHSSPETTCEFGTGTNKPVQLQFDRPGIVEVELHLPFEAPVVSLEVS